jgi:uncharacterized surface protein with fasciclin (FAS1) repeats
VTIKGSLNISLHFVSSKPKAKISIDQLEEQFNISKNIMKFNSIISAVKHAGKQNVYNSYKLLTPFIPSFVKTISSTVEKTKNIPM